MSRLEPLRPEQLDADQTVLYDSIAGGPRSNPHLTDEHGSLRGPFDLMLRSPEIGDALQRLGAALRFGGSLGDDVRELAILCAAAEWRCGFELKTHGRIAKDAGVPKDVVDALRVGDPVHLVSGDVYELVVRCAHELFSDHRVSESTYSDLIRVLGVPQTVELLLLFGYYTTLAMMLETFEISL